MNRRAMQAFTFVEILASLLFLAILIPVLTKAFTLANKASVVSERSALAAELAENKLSELMLNNGWMNGETQGNFGEDWPDYRWQLTQRQWDADSMTELSMEVFYPVQGQERSVRLVTLANTSGTLASSGTTTSSR